MWQATLVQTTKVSKYKIVQLNREHEFCAHKKKLDVGLIIERFTVK